MEAEGSLQEPTTGLYPEPVECKQNQHTLYFKIHLKLSSHIQA
jgi:hypothetical protein